MHYIGVEMLKKSINILKFNVFAVLTIFALSATPAAAECSISNAAKWTIGGAVLGVSVALVWGAGIIAAPFTGGTSIMGAAAASTGITLAVIGKAATVSAGSALLLGKVGAGLGGTAGVAITASGCMADD